MFGFINQFKACRFSSVRRDAFTFGQGNLARRTRHAVLSRLGCYSTSFDFVGHGRFRFSNNSRAYRPLAPETKSLIVRGVVQGEEDKVIP